MSPELGSSEIPVAFALLLQKITASRLRKGQDTQGAPVFRRNLRLLRRVSWLSCQRRVHASPQAWFSGLGCFFR